MAICGWARAKAARRGERRNVLFPPMLERWGGGGGGRRGEKMGEDGGGCRRSGGGGGTGAGNSRDGQTKRNGMNETDEIRRTSCPASCPMCRSSGSRAVCTAG